MDLTPQELAVITARVEVASPAPWEATAHQHAASGCRCLSCYDDPTGWYIDHAYALHCDEAAPDTPNDFRRERASCDEGPFLTYEDASFAAAARQDVPTLLAALAAMTKQRDWLLTEVGWLARAKFLRTFPQEQTT